MDTAKVTSPPIPAVSPVSDQIAMSQPIRIAVVSDESALQQLGADWDRLISESGAFSPMLSYAWVGAFLARRLRPGQRWACLCAYRDETLCGVLPLVLGPRKQMGVKYTSGAFPFDDSTPHADIG